MAFVSFATLFARLRPVACHNARIVLLRSDPHCFYETSAHRSPLVSPGKNAMFPCTSAAFTVPVVPLGFAVMCQLASTCSAFYAISVRHLAPLHSGFLQTSPRDLALAFG